jgi:hypothetical protein
MTSAIDQAAEALMRCAPPELAASQRRDLEADLRCAWYTEDGEGSPEETKKILQEIVHTFTSLGENL